jgi:cbb3-type cytochrome oxidase subunit 1
MPRLSVWVVRTALLYLGAGFTLGALMLSNKGVPYEPLVWRLRPVHVECLIFGWMVQLALGVAFWIMPRFTQEPRRGNPAFGWAGYALFNLGVLTVSLGLWFTWAGAALLLGRLTELAGAALFSANLWPRVRPFGV